MIHYILTFPSGSIIPNPTPVEEGVWRVTTTQTDNSTPVTYPKQIGIGKGTEQPYLCFSEGKMYAANKITGASGNQNGIFRLTP